MQLLFSRNFWLYLSLLLIVGVGAWLAYHTFVAPEAVVVESIQVEFGDVTETVTASAKVEAKQITRLGFPVAGTIQDIYKNAGDTVEAGEVIASLTSETLVAEYNAALEQLAIMKEQKQELLRGPIAEERTVAATNVQVAEVALAQVEAEYAQAIANARQNLLSTGLEAYPVDEDNDDVPPVISGSYLCEAEGSYHLSLYGSSADSNTSYLLSGLATGTYPANKITPAPLGDCGLYILFAADEIYRPSKWVVTVPNQRSASYVTLQNAYDLLLTQRAAAVSAAEEALALAKDSEELTVAPATREALAQADASIAQAEAQLALQDARIADFTIRAPFAGLVSGVDMKVGEPAGPAQTVTIVQEGDYDIKARVPEIDITKVAVGNEVLVTFDAEPNNPLLATITFISPVSSSVSGVSYYDAYLALLNPPAWLREGLNADVEIIAAAKRMVPTLPKRFVSEVNGQSVVLELTAEGTSRWVPVEIGMVGSDELVEVTNLSIGLEVLLP